MVGWITILIGLKQLWPSQNTIPAFTWRDWRTPYNVFELSIFQKQAYNVTTISAMCPSIQPYILSLPAFKESPEFSLTILFHILFTLTLILSHIHATLIELWRLCAYCHPITSSFIISLLTQYILALYGLLRCIFSYSASQHQFPTVVNNNYN
jgi:hypothetical protein